MSTPSSCEEMRPLVSALVDGELSAEESAFVRAHVATCASCRVLEDELRATSALVALHAPRPRMNELAWARFEEQLRREARPRVKREWRGLLGAAALVGLTWGLSLVLVVRPAASTLAFEPRHLAVLPYVEPVPVTANLPATRFADVANPAAAAKLTKAQRAALERDGLVQVPGDEAALAPFYEHADALVTADAALLVFGGATTRALVEAEREGIAPALRATLEHLDRELATIEERERGSVLRSAQLARRIVRVALELEGTKPTTHADDEAVLADVALARRAEGSAPSAVLGRTLDWSRFAPRGALRVLPGHFRAVTWLGEASLHVDAAHPDELRAASLIVLALARSPELLGRFADLDDAASLLHGPQDDLGALEVLRALRASLGSSARPDLLGRDEAVDAIARRAHDEVRATRAGALASLDAPGPKFRLIGGARSLEALVLSELSGDKLPGRARPTSLDLLAAMGSSGARALASSDGAPGYAQKLDDLAKVLEDVTQVPRAVARSGSGLERARLFALAKLVEAPTVRRPAVMETQAYADRLLMAALAGLDAPEPGAESGELVADLDAPLPAVEPLPAFYARLAHGARRVALGLAATTPGASRAAARLLRTSELLEGLAVAAQETLEGRGYSPQARFALASFASATRVLAPATAWSVDDVHVLHRADGARERLERVTGPLDRLYMVLPDADGKLRLVSGPALAARELLSPTPLSQDDVARTERHDPSWASHIVR